MFSHLLRPLRSVSKLYGRLDGYPTVCWHQAVVMLGPPTSYHAYNLLLLSTPLPSATPPLSCAIGGGGSNLNASPLDEKFKSNHSLPPPFR